MIIRNQAPVLPPVEPEPLEPLDDDEELLEELEELLEDDELLDDELEELLDEDELLLDEELDEDELLEELLVDLRTRMELRVPLSLLVVTRTSSLPSVTLASKVFFNTVLAPASAKISTLVNTF